MDLTRLYLFHWCRWNDSVRYFGQQRHRGGGSEGEGGERGDGGEGGGGDGVGDGGGGEESRQERHIARQVTSKLKHSAAGRVDTGESLIGPPHDRMLLLYLRDACPAVPFHEVQKVDE